MVPIYQKGWSEMTLKTDHFYSSSHVFNNRALIGQPWEGGTALLLWVRKLSLEDENNFSALCWVMCPSKASKPCLALKSLVFFIKPNCHITILLHLGDHIELPPNQCFPVLLSLCPSWSLQGLHLHPALADVLVFEEGEESRISTAWQPQFPPSFYCTARGHSCLGVGKCCHSDQEKSLCVIQQCLCACPLGTNGEAALHCDKYQEVPRSSPESGSPL